MILFCWTIVQYFLHLSFKIFCISDISFSFPFMLFPFGRNYLISPFVFLFVARSYEEYVCAKNTFMFLLSSSASLLNSKPLSEVIDLKFFFPIFLNSFCRALLTFWAFSLAKKRIYVYLLFLSTNVII